MTRKDAKEMFRKDKDSYGKPRAIMKKIDMIYDDFEKKPRVIPSVLSSDRAKNEGRDEPIGVDDVVKTYFDEIGVVREVKEFVWVTWYYIEIIKGKAFSEPGEITEYKRENLTKLL